MLIENDFFSFLLFYAGLSWRTHSLEFSSQLSAASTRVAILLNLRLSWTISVVSKMSNLCDTHTGVLSKDFAIRGRGGYILDFYMYIGF